MDILDPPEHVRLEFRRILLNDNEGDILAANRAYQEFNDLRRYALAMERLIDQEEVAEIEALRLQADKLEKNDQGLFWAWYYPVHWDQVVRDLFRRSTVIAIVAFVETALNQVARDIRLITLEELKANDLSGGVINKNRRYLKRFGGFLVSNEAWNQIEDIVLVRHAIVHANGNIDQSKNSKKIRDIIKKSPGLEEDMGILTIDKEYLEHCLECVQKFLLVLSDEMKNLCKRRQQFEGEESSLSTHSRSFFSHD